MAKRSGAVVEIVDDNSDGDIILASRVLINGVDVGWVKVDSLKINPGDHDDPATVTLTLMPSKIVVRGPE